MWAERDAKAIAIAKSKLLTEIQINKKVMRQAWEDSLREITSQKQITTPGGARGKAEEDDSEPNKERQEASLRTEQRDGNVQFMRELRECMRFEAEILGLFTQQPMSQQITKPIQIIRVRGRP
jgi:hypothetical protein